LRGSWACDFRFGGFWDLGIWDERGCFSVVSRFWGFWALWFGRFLVFLGLGFWIWRVLGLGDKGLRGISLWYSGFEWFLGLGFGIWRVWGLGDLG
jgi:hypothetical protein